MSRLSYRAVPGALCATLALAIGGPAAAARELSWPSIDVVARLEADGSLAVAETQTMRMTGDWNGGERILRVEPHQRVRLVRLVRVDPASGREVVLERGDLDRVDRWDWSSGRRLRWRSRLPSDPPFENTLLVYRLELVYERLFEPKDGSSYRLAHDFAFADRDGPIERFTLTLDAAPGWRVAGELEGADGARRRTLPARFEAGPIAPGSGFVVRGELDWSGSVPPELAAPSAGDASWRFAAAAAVAASALVWGVFWWRRDAALGRFAPLVEPAAVDRDWLENRIFAERPEVVGATWDRSIGGAEVAAMLARLVAEGRLASTLRRRGGAWLGRDVLELELRVPRESFDESERRLIAGLFPKGDRTDTDSLRAHYRSTGFDPVSKIRAQLEQRVRALAGFAERAPRPRRRPTVLLVAAGVALVVTAAIADPGARAAFVMLPLALLAAIPGFVTALVGRSRLGLPLPALVGILISTLVGTGLVVFLGAAFALPPTASAGAALLFAGLLRGMFQTLAIPESARSLERRRELAGARRYLAAELARREPRLEDRWLPWLIALGLAPDCARWSKRWQVAAPSHGAGGSFAGGGATSTPGTGAGGWSGGGGQFGGAGATASFAAAATSLAGGVPSPSSGGSSGGGGGSSSGGGGGGGW